MRIPHPGREQEAPDLPALAFPERRSFYGNARVFSFLPDTADASLKRNVALPRSFLVGAGPALRPRQSLRQLGLGGAAGKIELSLGEAGDAAEVGAAELGQEKVRSGHVRALEVESGQTGARQIGEAEVNPRQLGVDEYH